MLMKHIPGGVGPRTGRPSCKMRQSIGEVILLCIYNTESSAKNRTDAMMFIENEK